MTSIYHFQARHLFVALLLALLACPSYLSAQVERKPIISDPVTPISFDKDLRNLPRTKLWKPGDSIRVVPFGINPDSSTYDVPKPIPDSLNFPQGSSDSNNKNVDLDQWNNLMAPPPVPLPVTSFQGIPSTGLVPPDIVGDVGPNHYIQMVNSNFAIFAKDGTPLVGPTPINSLWSGFGGPCETNNNGDPIVQYDPMADRWLMSQFAIPGGAAGFHECICISKTPDPVAGGWHLYDFTTPVLPDYPKFGVWPDAYYMSTFESGSLGMFAFQRDRMLNGLPAISVRFTMPTLGTGRSQTRILPSDLDGATLPPPGSPNYFVQSVDGPPQGGGNDRLEVYEFQVDFTNPPLSTFNGPINLLTQPFDIEMCGPFMPRNCIPQPITNRRLDPLSNRLMRRLQYRNFGGHESLVVNQTVDANRQDQAGIRWYELRKAGGGAWAIEQQGTHSPPDSINRWMGSIAMNSGGTIGLGYSVSSRTVFPGLRFTSHQPGDPLGSMIGEQTLINGAGSQTGSSRWGDYSSMNVDPVDDCTFWFTSEFYDATSNGGWKTLISRMEDPNCNIQPFNYMYSSKIVCGTQREFNNLRLARGVYSTTINIHNPNEIDVKFLKKLAFSYPPAEQRQGRIDTIAIDLLGPDGALSTDCIDIQRRLYPNGFPTPYIEGFVVIESPEPLDVTAVYTAAKLKSFLSPQRVTSIDIEQIRERKLNPKEEGCPDLVVQAIHDVKSDCPAGTFSCVTTVSVTIANVGTAHAGPFSVRFEINPGIILTEVVPGGMAAGSSQVITVNTLPGRGCFNPDCSVTVFIDSGQTVDECNENNNKLSISIIG